MAFERRLGVLAIAFAMTLSTAAFAEPTAADRETARSLMAQGREKREAGDHAGALKAFMGADAIMKVPTTGIEVARTQAQLGDLLTARETLLAVLRRQPQPGDPPPFAEATKAAEALDEDLSRKIPSLVVRVPNAPAEGLTVTIDDQPVPAALLGMPRKTNPGHHVVVAKAGTDSARAEVDLAPSETKEIELALAGAAKPADRPEGPSRPIPTLAWVGFGVGAAGLLAGSITGLMSISKTNDLEPQCPGGRCPRSAQNDYDSAQTLATISNVGFVVGIVGVGVGVVALVTRPAASRPTQGAAPLVPRFASNGVAFDF